MQRSKSIVPPWIDSISSAALHASCLSEYLTSGPDLDQPARTFFDLQRVIVDAAWQTSAVPDLALPHVGAPRTLVSRASEAYANMLLDATVTDLERRCSGRARELHRSLVEVHAAVLAVHGADPQHVWDRRQALDTELEQLATVEFQLDRR